MRRSVGLHIGDDRVSAALVGKKRNSIAVLRFATAPLRLEGTATSRDALLDAINLVMNELAVVTEDVVVSIPSNRCILSNVAVPFTDARKIRKTIKFDTEGELPCSADSVVLDWLTVRRSPHSSHVMTVAVRKEVLREYLEILEQCDVEAVAVQPDFCALHNAVAILNGDAGPRLVLTSSEKKIGALAVLDDAPAFYAEAALNGSPEALEGCIASLQANLGDAEFSSVVINGENEAILQASASLYGERLSQIRLDGVSSPLDPEERSDFAKHGLIAFGLALKELVTVSADCDMRKEELEYPHRLQPLKTPLMVLLCALFLVFFTSGMYLRRGIAVRESELAAIKAKTEERWRDSFRKRGTTPPGLLTQMKSELAALKGMTEDRGTSGYASFAMPALNDIIDRIGKDAKNLRIESVELKQGIGTGGIDAGTEPCFIIRASVATTDAQEGYKIKDRIAESPYVRDVSCDEFRAQDGRLPLNLRVVLKCVAGSDPFTERSPQASINRCLWTSS